MRLIKTAFALWIFCAGWALAQTAEQGIIVTGEGRVAVAPDMASITLGVTETAETAGEVMAQVNTSVAAILEELDRLGIAARDRQTSGFYLQPVQNNRGTLESGQAPQITGYRAGNTVSVRVRDLQGLGPLMDAVIAIGANDFNGLQFGVQDSSEAQAQARARAVADAMLRARQLADAAGLTLGQVLQMRESSHQGGPVMMEMARASVGDALAQGEIDVSAQVTMVFDILPGQ